MAALPEDRDRYQAIRQKITMQAKDDVQSFRNGMISAIAEHILLLHQRIDVLEEKLAKVQGSKVRIKAGDYSTKRY